MMTLKQYNRFCGALPATTHVVQWGDAHVWKVGGKVFAIGNVEGTLSVRFKCSPLTFDILREQSGCRPAPYLASRGLKWIQRFSDESVDDAAFKDYLRESYRMIAAALPKRIRAELGLAVSV